MNESWWTETTIETYLHLHSEYLSTGFCGFIYLQDSLSELFQLCCFAFNLLMLTGIKWWTAMSFPRRIPGSVSNECSAKPCDSLKSRAIGPARQPPIFFHLEHQFSIQHSRSGSIRTNHHSMSDINYSIFIQVIDHTALCRYLRVIILYTLWCQTWLAGKSPNWMGF